MASYVTRQLGTGQWAQQQGAAEGLSQLCCWVAMRGAAMEELCRLHSQGDSMSLTGDLWRIHKLHDWLAMSHSDLGIDF